MQRAMTLFAGMMLDQRGHLFPWCPVALACGVGLYFWLKFEPTGGLLLGCAVAGGAGLAAGRWLDAVWRPVSVAISLAVLGFALAGARAHTVSGPVLDFRYYGPIEGRVVGIDRSASDALRLTLDRVVLSRIDPEDTPARVRVSLHGQQGVPVPPPGAVVILTGHLTGPGGAVEPGGFDFRRHAWFFRLGAVGYTRSPVLLLDPPAGGQYLFKARMWLSHRVQSQLAGKSGAFAAALMTGDRSGMPQEVLEQLRITNLAHLLAISGLHMGLLAGFVFASVRLALLLVPHSRHHWPVKKLAAGAALAAALAYLALSGGSLATQRAFVMAAVALIAVILNRRALSLRSVAMAALIILVHRPEALISAGFQMSFAATTALVFVFEQIAKWQGGRRMPGWFAPVFGLVVSSAVAGAATAPVGMVHFNSLSQFGLVANLASVPVMGLVVMPMAVLAAVLMPLGLDWIALTLMAFGLDWILWVAEGVAHWDSARRWVKAPDPLVLPLLAMGGLILCLWQGRGRLASLLPVAAAILLWAQTERPPVLVSDTGSVVGIMTEQGRGLSRAKGSDFVVRNWLENDGQGGSQEAAAALWPGSVQARLAVGQVYGWELLHAQGKKAAARIPTCHQRQIVISSVEASPSGTCIVIDPKSLRLSGALSIRFDDGAPRIVSERDMSGTRIWHGRTDQ